MGCWHPGMDEMIYAGSEEVNHLRGGATTGHGPFHQL